MAEEDANLPSRLLNLMPGDTVYVTDKDEDGQTFSMRGCMLLLNNSLGWWYVSGETGEGWYPSTLLRVYSSFMPQDTTESDVVYQDTESVNRSHQPEIFYTLREYSGERDDEVSFGEGMPLRVLHKSKSGWWTVRYTTYTIKTFCMYVIKTFCIIVIILSKLSASCVWASKSVRLLIGCNGDCDIYVSLIYAPYEFVQHSCIQFSFLRLTQSSYYTR